MSGTSDRLSEMPAEDLTTAVIELPFHHRVRLGVRKGKNWMQLVRFGAVGASGYAVNLISFAVLVHLLGVTYWVASPIAYLLGTANNFYWNRRWTFSHAREAHPVHQAWKFFAVSLLSFGVNYGVLITLGQDDRDGAGARPGDRQRGRDAGQLPRPEALELQGVTPS